MGQRAAGGAVRLRAMSSENQTASLATMQAGDVLVSHSTAVREHEISIVPNGCHSMSPTHAAALVDGRSAAEAMGVDAWLSEDQTHVVKIASHRRSDTLTDAAAIEAAAEVLTVHQLDLLAQLEAQLRAVHHTMRCIDRLRRAEYRVGPELTDDARAATVTVLASEVAALNDQSHIQQQSCEEMTRLIRTMQMRLGRLKLGSRD
jgi:hypothetical protein